MAGLPSAAGPAAATAATDPLIAAAGDISCDPGSPSFNSGNGTSSACRQKYTASLLHGATAVLSLGDLQYEDATYAKFLQSYDRSWGAHKAITRPVVGNHEYLTPGATGYFDYFGASALSNGRSYYSFDLGNWHLIALNANCSQVGGCGAGSSQEAWLKADLAKTTKSCILAYWHHPRFSSGSHGSDTAYDAFWRALYAARADVVLNGHDHDYERFGLQNPDGQADANGIREFVVGTGGKGLTNFGTIRANSQFRNATTYGVLKMVLHSNSYEWQFTPEGRKPTLDSGATTCHGSVPTAALVSTFRATRTAAGVAVSWRTTRAARTLGFNLYREHAGRRVRLNRSLIGVLGSSRWIDRAAPAAQVRYRLQALDLARRATWVGDVTVPSLS